MTNQAERAIAGELLERLDSKGPGVTVDGVPLSQTAGMGGAFEGADRLGRQLASWTPRQTSADSSLSHRDKLVLDARGHDMLRNSGPFQGASNLHKDSIVGMQYRLNASPNQAVLGAGFDDTWAEEFQIEVEAKFTLGMESPDCWIDAARRNTLTDLVRMAIGVYFAGGEVVSTAEWIRGSLRPFSTAIQMVDADRLSNPFDAADTKFLRRGIELDARGAPLAAHFRMAHPKDSFAGADAFNWKRVPIRKPWGRIQVIHLFDQTRPDQTRGVAEMVAVLKEARMSKSFHEVSLQNAIVQASYAAAIESELPPDMAFDMIGAGSNSEQRTNASLTYLQAIAEYSRGGRNLEIDGVKIPHLFPGSKLKLYPAGTVGGVGQNFEESLDRNVSAGLGISYEEFSHNFSQANYSNMRAAQNNTRRVMQTKKRKVADAFANHVYMLWMEEQINAKGIDSLPQRAKSGDFFYEPLMRDALCEASWIGAGRGQVDELKETQAALLRIKGGLSTYEQEAAVLGADFRRLFKQAAREKGLIEKLGLEFNMEPTKPGTLSAERDDGGEEEGAKKPAKKALAYDDGFGD